MKQLLIIGLIGLFSLTANAQEKKDLVLNQETNLIEAVVYHDNGAIAQTGTYNIAGKLHGKWISFDNQGQKTAVALYENGYKVGTWLFYQGDILKEVTYTNNAISEVNTWAIRDSRIVTRN